MITLIEGDAYQADVRILSILVPIMDTGGGQWGHALLSLEARMKKPQASYSLDLIRQLKQAMDCDRDSRNGESLG